MKGYRPELEQLEDRTVPTVLGSAWADVGQLTVSFVPDGTLVGGQASTLYSTLNAAMDTSVWQNEIFSALQTWASAIGVQLTLVADDGSALGTAGAQQGDGRFGDIRIAARSLGQAAVATAIPVDDSAGTYSGDIILNTDYLFSSTGAGSTYDLYTVLLHEGGHSFGMGDTTTDQSSVMYTYYIDARDGLSSADVANVRALYQYFPGGSDNNDTLGTATVVSQTGYGMYGYEPNYLVYGNIGQAGDVDYYALYSPMPGYNFWATVQLNNHSETASVSLVDAYGNSVGATVTSNGAGGYSVYATNMNWGNYYLKVEGSTGTATPGAYSVEAGYKSQWAFPMYQLQGSVDAWSPQTFRAVSVTMASLVNFEVNVTGASGSAVEVAVYDNNGNFLTTQFIPTNTTVEFQLFLSPGTYNIRVSGGTEDGSPLGRIDFTVVGTMLNDPIGPKLVDPSSAPPRNLYPQWMAQAIMTIHAVFDPYGRPYGSNNPPPGGGGGGSGGGGMPGNP